MKRDRIFIIVLAIILANLVFIIGGAVNTLASNITSWGAWALLIADLSALIGALWLLRSYRRRIVYAKKEAGEEKESN